MSTNHRTRIPTPSPENRQRILAATEAISPAATEMQEWFLRYATTHVDRLTIDVDLIQHAVPQGQKILEVGSVPLLLTQAVAELGYDIHGVDVGPERFASTIDRLGLKVSKCNIEVEPLPFPDQTFDVALFNEIFEHLRINPVLTMNEVARVLRPGGLLFLSTPNLRSLNGLTNFLLHDKSESSCTDVYEEYGKLEQIGHMGHVREYTVTEVQTFLTKVGFEPVDLIFRGGERYRRKRLLFNLIPSLQPFFTIIARKR
ncbi:MAG: class I SAM-dependent methyltransferase [Caldilineaceae bacterium]|nr:class I SAM-dependent methyltransferase [Caldilineaceae bacterium]